MQTLHNTQATKNLSIIKYPTGLFGWVGSVPIELTVERKNSIGQTINASKVYKTEAAAIADAKSVNAY